MKPFATSVFLVLTIVLINVYRAHGSYGVRAWFAAKLLNKQMNKPMDTKPTAKNYRLAGVRTASELAWKAAG